nr:DUF1592 domain-containing protein [Haloferula luteola]
MSAQDGRPEGAAIYAQYCASCHGEEGQGVPDEVDEPLRGDRSLDSLARYIDRRMPEDDPDLLNAEESSKVAEYIYHAFYAVEAGAEERPRPAFARLTNRQFRESVADLLGSFGQSHSRGEGTGLRAVYFDSDGMNKKARKALEREDRQMSFDFGTGAPAEGMKEDQFSIAWEGSLLPPETGWYEFKLITPNGARLYLNGDSQEGDGNFRDDSGAKRQPAFVDAWVSSGSEDREVTARMFLLGGRAYPIRLDYFKYLDPSGRLRLEWTPPHGVSEVLEAPFLSPASATRVAVCSTPFPADDASEGYERGTGVTQAWHDATTAAAVEVANQVVDRLRVLSGVEENDPQRVEKLKEFVATMAARAFRRGLSEDLRQRYVVAPFEGLTSPEAAVKRAVILILKSPRFLYPEIESSVDDFTVASRLALGMWDSLPDRELREAAEQGRLRSPEPIEAQARRMMEDPRARAKLHAFFQRWLKLDGEGDLQKDPEAFPGFDAQMVSDLRRSLEIFVDTIVWSDASDYRELILSSEIPLNARLAKYYEAPIPEGRGFVEVAFDPAQRAGILTHPYLLARLAHPDSTSPIHRGVFVSRNVLGGLLKPPPEAIAFDNHQFDPRMTMREKVAEMTRSANCMTCHETINPLGFSLENFDAVGRFRTTEGERMIDAESDFPSFGGHTLRLRGPRDVAEHAVASDQARRGFIRQILQYQLKQNPAVYGRGMLDQLDHHFAASGYHIRNLLVTLQSQAALLGAPNPESAR